MVLLGSITIGSLSKAIMNRRLSFAVLVFTNLFFSAANIHAENQAPLDEQCIPKSVEQNVLRCPESLSLEQNEIDNIRSDAELVLQNMVFTFGEIPKRKQNKKVECMNKCLGRQFDPKKVRNHGRCEIMCSISNRQRVRLFWNDGLHTSIHDLQSGIERIS